MNTTTTTSQPETDYQDHRGHSYRETPPLERPVHDRMLGGVAAGAARYLGVDPTVIRIILAVLVVVGGMGIPLYIAGWLLIPEEGRDQSLASELVRSFRDKRN